MFRSMPRSTSSRRPMCRKLLCRSSTMTRASGITVSFVANTLDRSQAARGDGGVNGGQGGDDERRQRYQDEVGKICRDGQAVDVINVGVQAQTEQGQALDGGKAR